MAATYDADSWMKENTARRATRRSKQHKETGFIRRVSDDQFPHTAALKATNGLNVPTEEKDPFDLPTPLMIYSLNKKGRWNCVQRLRSIDDMQSPSVQVTALEKYLQAGSPPTPTALDDKKMTAALRVVDEHVVALADDRNPTPPRSTEQQLVRSTSVDSLSDTRQQVSYEVALLHPSAALWTKHAKESARLGKLCGRRGTTTRKTRQRFDSASVLDELETARAIMTGGGKMDKSDSEPSPTLRKPLVVPLVDCIRLKPTSNGKNKTKKNGATPEATKNVGEWEVVADESKTEFDGDWELV